MAWRNRKERGGTAEVLFSKMADPQCPAVCQLNVLPLSSPPSESVCRRARVSEKAKTRSRKHRLCRRDKEGGGGSNIDCEHLL